MRVNFLSGVCDDMPGTVPVCKFEFYITMPRGIETQEEAVRCILAQLETMLGLARQDLPKGEIWVNGKQLPREAEKGGGKT